MNVDESGCKFMIENLSDLLTDWMTDWLTLKTKLSFYCSISAISNKIKWDHMNIQQASKYLQSLGQNAQLPQGQNLFWCKNMNISKA